MIVSYWILADIEYIERIWKTRLACNNHPCSKCNSTKCFHQPYHPNSWEILWMGGCQVIHMSSFWNLQRHQSAGQRLQPGISTRLTSFLGWVKMSDPETKKKHGRQFFKKIGDETSIFFFVYPTFTHPHPAIEKTASFPEPRTRHHFARDPRVRWWRWCGCCSQRQTSDISDPPGKNEKMCDNKIQ